MNKELIATPENKTESLIDLKNLSFEFCSDELIVKSKNKELTELENQKKWTEENQSKWERKKDKIEEAVRMGFLIDSKLETIRQSKINRLEKDQTKTIEVKKELEQKIEAIKNEVTKKLAKYLPNWKAKETNIIFTINEEADFCINGNTITADLGRLIFSQNPQETVIEGLTHEVFHAWMNEQKDYSEAEDETIQEMKEWTFFRTINEGLAVLISGQSIENHHEKQGKNYPEYKIESFKVFENFLKENNPDWKKIKKECFENMGYFYVVGYEISKSILEKEGLQNFKKLIIQARQDPEIFLKEYGIEKL
jgi:hypothetical protein